MSPTVRTLVADDSDYMRQMLIMMLKKINITDVVEASDGDEAIEQLRRNRVSLVLLDCVMPRVDGFQVLKAIRADPALASLPVILITANADDASLAAASTPECRADAIIAKPLSLATLRARIAEVMATRG